MPDVWLSLCGTSLMGAAYDRDTIHPGDFITLGDFPGMVARFRGKRGKVIGWDGENRVEVDFPDISGVSRIGTKNIVSVESANPEPTQEEIDRLFGIKKDEELRAEAEKLISICHANILRLEARVLRLEADEDDKSDDAWKVVVQANNEVKLARAAGLELEADYIERWGTQAHRKAFN